MIRLCTLGEAAIEVGKRRYGTEADLVFATTLYLASQHGRRVPRPTLLELFWPRVADESRRHNLRQLVYKLRRIGVPCQSDTTHVSLRADDVVADYDTYFSPRVAEGEVVRPDAPFGEFLAGYAPRISPAFAEWVENRRAEVHGQMRRVLLASLSASKQRGEWLEVDRLARRVIQIDTLNEEATLALAEATAMSGSKVAAVAMLDRYVEELGPGATEIRLPATVLRRRVQQAIKRVAPAASNDLPFVGREDLVVWFNDALANLRTKRGTALWLWGDPGIGKSRVCAELQLITELHGSSCLAVQLSSVGGAPLALVSNLASQLSGMPGALACSTNSYALLRRFTSGGSVHDNANHFSAAQTEALLGESLSEMLIAVSAERPLVLLVDDGDRADTASLRVLRAVGNRTTGASVLVVVTGRTQQTELGFRALDWRSTRLAPFSAAESHRFLDALDSSCPPEARDSLVNLARGNPLFLQELATHWRRRGEVAQLPTNLARAIEESFERLDSTALHVLQAIALAGHHATLDLLERTLEIGALELLAAIEALEKENMLSGDTLRLRHPVIAERAISLLGIHSKCLLHRRIALVLEVQVSDSSLPALLSDCLLHWRQANDSGHVARLTPRYATALLKAGLPENAAQTLVEAGEFCSDLKAKRELLECLVDVYALLSEWMRVREIWLQIAAIDETLDASQERHSTAELRALDAQWHLDVDHARVLARVLRCAADTRAGTEHRLQAAALGLGLADNFHELELRSHLHGLSETLSPSTENGRVYKLQADVIFYTSTGNPARALFSAHALATAAPQITTTVDRQRSLRQAATAFRAFGCTVEAETLLLQAAEDAMAGGLRDQAALAYQCLAANAIDLAKLDAAELYLAKSVTIEGHEEDQVDLSRGQLIRARIAILQNDSGRAIAALPPRDAILRCRSARQRSSVLAAWIHAQLRADSHFQPEHSDVAILESALEEATHHVGKDFLLMATYLAYNRLNASDHARLLLRKHVDQLRTLGAPMLEGLLQI